MFIIKKIIIVFLTTLIFFPLNAFGYQDPTTNKRLILSEIDETFFCVEKKEISMNSINLLEKEQLNLYRPNFNYLSNIFKLKINTLENKLIIINTYDEIYDVKTQTKKKTKPVVVETMGVITSFDNYNLNAILDYSFVRKVDGKENSSGWFGKPSNRIEVMSFNTENLSFTISRQVEFEEDTDVFTIIGNCQR